MTTYATILATILVTIYLINKGKSRDNEKCLFFFKENILFEKQKSKSKAKNGEQQKNQITINKLTNF